MNERIEELSEEVRVNFAELERETNALKSSLDSAKANKEQKEKLKKEAKSLMNQKNKFLSDMLKQLSEMGVSYRRGNLQHSQKELSQLVVFNEPQKDSKLAEFFSYSHRLYLSAVDRFLSFKNLHEKGHLPGTAPRDLHLLPVEKFKGFSAHLMHIVSEQKKAIHLILNELSALEASEAQGGIVETASEIEKAPANLIIDFERFLDLKLNRVSQVLKECECFMETSDVVKEDAVKTKLAEEKKRTESFLIKK